MMKALQRIRYMGKEWYFDERLSELRHALYPWERIRLNDSEALWIKITGHCPWELSVG